MHTCTHTHTQTRSDAATMAHAHSKCNRRACSKPDVNTIEDSSSNIMCLSGHARTHGALRDVRMRAHARVSGSDVSLLWQLGAGDAECARSGARQQGGTMVIMLYTSVIEAAPTCLRASFDEDAVE